MQWYNEPASWKQDNDVIEITADGQTDFWRVTRHGYIVDNGHFYYQDVTGDFIAQVKFTGEYNALYDQAGLMVRLDEKIWLKCGIEFVEGMQNASVVITRDFSDWSVIPLANHPRSVWFRVVRYGASVEIFYSLDGTTYTMMREAYLTPAPILQVGIMAAAPRGDGFSTRFEELSIRSRE